jgi:threonine/homoserine/homoserine lactone efflux protein
VRLNDVLALVTFVAVGAGSPGPNNTLLLASGISFGFRRTLPHVIGTGLGIAGLILIVRTGVGVLVAAEPRVQLGLKVVASAYLVYLAVRLAGGVSLDPSGSTEPFTIPHAVAFQFVNPKAWIFALALVAAFASGSGPGSDAPATAITVGVVCLVVLVTAAAWSLGGDALRRWLEGERARRAAGFALGALLMVSVVLLWR